jgi:hypothetical protein
MIPPPELSHTSFGLDIDFDVDFEFRQLILVFGIRTFACDFPVLVGR